MNGALHASSDIEVARDRGPNRSRRFDKISEDPVDGVFVKDPQIPIGEDIIFEGFQFYAPLIRHVVNGDDPEIGETCLGTDGGELGDGDRDLVALELIFEAVDPRKPSIHSGAGMLFRVSRHRNSSDDSIFIFHHNSKLPDIQFITRPLLAIETVFRHN